MKLLPLLLSFLVLTGCQSGLYTPATPNVPLVDSTKRTEVKVGFSARHVEAQANWWLKDNHVLQLQLSQRPSMGNQGGRYEMGFGKMRHLSSTLYRYNIWGLGYSYFVHSHAFSFFDSRDWGTSSQIPFYTQFGLVKSQRKHKWAFTFRPSIMYSPYSKTRIYFHESGVVKFYHIFYSVMDLSASYRIGSFSFTLGSKLPGPTSHSDLKRFNLVEEYLYLRVNLRPFK